MTHPNSEIERSREEILASYREKLGRMRDEIEGLKSENFEAFKEVKLPVARIKKIMKSD